MNEIAFEMHRVGWNLYTYQCRYGDTICLGMGTRRKVRRLVSEWLLSLGGRKV